MNIKDQLEWTGERMTPEAVGDVQAEHLHRYLFTIPFIRNKRILDIACGEGYGTNLMSKYALSVVGVDIDEKTINHATKKYKRDNIGFKVGAAHKIPLNDRSVDVVVSFETLEHHDKHDEMLSEFRRILTPNGILIISSPEKRKYTDERNYHNPFHIKELYYEELKTLLCKYFKYNYYFMQSTFKGSLIIPENNNGSLRLSGGVINNYYTNRNFLPRIIIAVCCDSQMEVPMLLEGFESNEIIEIEIRERLSSARNDGINYVKNHSRIYKIGNYITAPLRWILGKK